MKMNKNKEYNKVLDYLKNHLEDYSDAEINYIVNNLDILENMKFVPDVLRQIYDEVGILEDEENLYIGFVDMLEENFDIDKNIVEVGGGVIPSLAKHISLRQKNGTITVYDPRLSNSLDSNEQFILKKEKFGENTKIEDFDLLIGFMPCQATEVLIKQATANRKDFMIALCEGRHNEFDDYFDEDIWTSNMFYLAMSGIEENNLGIFIENDLKNYHDPYPVIYNKRKILK